MAESFGAGSDFSFFSGAAGPPTIASLTTAGNTLLATGTVTYKGFIYFQNQSSTPIYILLDAGAGDLSPITVLTLDPGAGLGRQGGATDPLPWFIGRVRIYGIAGSSQFAGRCY